MTYFAGSHNFNTECYNINIGCHNFLRRRGVFLSFKISNEKMKLQTLHAHWKVVAIWINRTKWCTPCQIFCTAHGAQRIFLFSYCFQCHICLKGSDYLTKVKSSKFFFLFFFLCEDQHLSGASFFSVIDQSERFSSLDYHKLSFDCNTTQWVRIFS